MRKKNINKHSKIKNTGLLFEFLLRQITSDVLSNKNKSMAMTMIKHRFNENTELGKELSLYQMIINHSFNSDKKANFFITEVINNRNRLNNSLLKREKYNLIKEIKNNFNLIAFLSSKVTNYKTYASIYKLFEYKKTISPEEKTVSYFNLIEHLTTKNKSRLTDSYKNKIPKDENLRILTYRLLLEKFNKKYEKLNYKQKALLKEYINNVSNTNSLKEHIKIEVKYVKNELNKHKKNIKDKITKIKLNESINSIEKFCKTGNSKFVKDDAVIQLMRYYELIKEVKKHG